MTGNRAYRVRRARATRNRRRRTLASTRSGLNIARRLQGRIPAEYSNYLRGVARDVTSGNYRRRRVLRHTRRSNVSHHAATVGRARMNGWPIRNAAEQADDLEFYWPRSRRRQRGFY